MTASKEVEESQGRKVKKLEGALPERTGCIL
jgi:hypothetical protein